MGEVYSTFTSQKQINVGAFPDGRAVSVEVFDNSIDFDSYLSAMLRWSKGFPFCLLCQS